MKKKRERTVEEIQKNIETYAEGYKKALEYMKVAETEYLIARSRKSIQLHHLRQWEYQLRRKLKNERKN